MANTRDKLESLVLSAQEVRALTGWDDVMTEEWLNLIRNFVQLADSVDEVQQVDIGTVDQEIADVFGQVAKVRGRFSALEQAIKQIEQLINAYTSSAYGKAKAQINTLRRDTQTFSPIKAMTALIKGGGASNPTLTDSYNITSITRTGIGVYQITLTQPTIYGTNIDTFSLPFVHWIIAPAATAQYHVELVNTSPNTYNLNVYSVTVGVSPALTRTAYDLQLTDTVDCMLLLNLGGGRLPPP